MRLRFAVIVFVLVSCIVVALVSLLPPTLELVSSSEDDTKARFNAVVATLTSIVTDFIVNAQNLPESIGDLWGKDGIDFLNETTALPIFTTLLRSCGAACTAIYYGTPGDQHMIRSDVEWCRIANDVAHTRDCCPVATLFDVACTSPMVNTGRVYRPTLRPWYAPLAKGPGWSSLYADFSTGGYAATVGAPILTRNGTFLGVMAADITFGPLVKLLANMHLVDAPSAWALYEAGSNNLLDSSIGVRSNASLATLSNLSSTSLGPAVASLSPAELAFDGTIIKPSGSPLSRDYVAVARVANVTGVNLRVIVHFIEDPTGAKKDAVVVSIVLTVCAVIFSSIFIAAAAIFFFERPLKAISEAINFAVARAMGLQNDDDESDEDDGEHTRISSQADQTVLLPDSHIEELQNITDSFCDLTEELKRIRAFVPKSCLVTTEAVLDTLEVLSEGADVTPPALTTQLPGDRDSDLSSIHSNATVPHNHPLESPGHAAVGGDDKARSSRSGSVIGGSVRETPSKLVQSRSLGRLPHPRSGHLYTGKSLHPATVTYACIHLRNVTEALEALPDVTLGYEALGLIADCCDLVSRRNNGVLDVYSGDRMTIAFNAMKPNTTHRRASVECVVTIARLVRALSIDHSRELCVALNKHTLDWQHVSGAKIAPDDHSRTLIFPHGISAGISTSRALVGNAGSASVARFSIVGLCVRTAASEEAKCNALEPTVQCVCDVSYRGDISHSVAFQRIDTNVIAPARMLLDDTGAKKGKHDDNDGEWMYELQRAQQANEFNDINDAFDAFVRGDSSGAQAKLAAAEQRPDAAKAVVGIERLKRLLGR